ncbi:hypothetical protein EV424DRAFT_1378006 [Suillus variegatus]|nr:hypothetical protein EV424DRAFT_1378006 [Suillus variegatus]
MGRNKSQKSSVPQKSKLKKDPGIPRLPQLKVRIAEKRKSSSVRCIRVLTITTSS